MKKNFTISIAVLALIALGFVVYSNINKKAQSPSVVSESRITGCYVATLGKDIYTLNIQSQNDASVSGRLVFKNFQKDSSSGSFAGTYRDGILLGDYSFNSEGMDSVMQVIFKRQGSDFIRGYGPVDQSGTRFTDLSAVTYDMQAVFEASSGTCATSLSDQNWSLPENAK